MKKIQKIIKKLSIYLWLRKHKVKNYAIMKHSVQGYLVNVSGDVELTNIKSIDVNFNYVGGSFNCSHNQLKSLKGSPYFVGKNFICDYNNLHSLEHCPQFVGMIFSCSHNNLLSLDYFPKDVGFGLDCSSNKLTSLLFCPNVLCVHCENNPTEDLQHLPQSLTSLLCDKSQMLKSKIFENSDAIKFFEEGPQDIYFSEHGNSISSLKKMLKIKEEKKMLSTIICLKKSPVLKL